jgi:hypothetical protein
LNSNIVLLIIFGFIVVCVLRYWENSKSHWNEFELLWKPNWIGVIDMPPYIAYGKLSSNWEIKGCSWFIQSHILLECMSYHLPWLSIWVI